MRRRGVAGGRRRPDRSHAATSAEPAARSRGRQLELARCWPSARCRHAPEPEPLPRRRRPGRRRCIAIPLARRLFEESYDFDFFQAVRLAPAHGTRASPGRPGRAAPGRGGPIPARISLSFPPSSIYELRRPTSNLPVPVMVQAFMGLTGPSGVLPRHYTELLYKIEREIRTPEKHALRDWLDLFNHRLVSLFYRAWEKYRFYVPFERGEHTTAPSRTRSRTACTAWSAWGPRPCGGDCASSPGTQSTNTASRRSASSPGSKTWSCSHFSGTLGHRPRCAVALEAMLQDYFQVPARIDQFQGQWLQLEPSSRTRLDGERREQPARRLGRGRGSRLGPAEQVPRATRPDDLRPVHRIPARP